jgi:hypothetical protein
LSIAHLDSAAAAHKTERMNTAIRSIAIGTLLAMLASCATIVSGSRQEVDITSDPPAQMSIRSGTGEVFFEGFAPATVDLPRSNSYDLTIRAPGYEDYVVTVRQEFNVWVIGNVVVGAVVIGTGIDLLTGAFWNLTPEFINVELERAQSAGLDAAGTVAVVTLVDQRGNETTVRAPLTSR